MWYSVDILPSSYPTHPLSWSEEELAELAGTGLDNATKTIRQVLEKVFEHLTEKLVNVIISQIRFLKF